MVDFKFLFLLGFTLLGAFVFGHDPRYQGIRQEQCLIAKNEIDYISKGRDWMLGNLSIYETADRTPTRMLISVHDIFGDTANSRLFADLLAEEYGFRIVAPDFFRGEPWDDKKWPPDPIEFDNWYENIASWEKVAQYDIQNIIKYYTLFDNITEFGIFGFCWGGKISTLAATFMPEIKAAGLVHPSSLNTSMVENVQRPMYLFPCLDDPDMLPYYEILKTKFGDNSGHRRYNDMCHGFATSMGNFSDPLNFQRVEQTIDILGNFMVRNMPNQ